MFKELFSLFVVFIALFLFGMVVMRVGLLELGQKKMKEKLYKLTSSPWKGLLVGALATALLQSSSAIMVMTVGLVAAGYLSFRQSIGIILGTNIGTTVTTELIAFDLSTFIFPMLAIGLIMLLLPTVVCYCIGCISFGLACIFIAMDGLETLAYPLASLPTIHSFFELTNNNELLGLGIGTILTAIIQSSTATTAIAMGFMNDHVLELSAGIAIMLGANIGTCITAYLASIGSGAASKLVAFAHGWLNLLGAVLFLPLIQWLSAVAISLTPIPMMQLAHASMIFNITCSLLMLPFVSHFERFVKWIHTTSPAK
ncbi:Na/Pi symporter [Halalkalibacter urbisdiaboli]|uniref:Na/Pi symporter n=1 Tax=Halalkalibacter urbisdiaboli TaxID=1960589 RepID=UPI000B4366C8|nr:Na/Pi symporter [Halalkalibacter urbisdiaboli]